MPTNKLEPLSGSSASGQRSRSRRRRFFLLNVSNKCWVKNLNQQKSLRILSNTFFLKRFWFQNFCQILTFFRQPMASLSIGHSSGCAPSAFPRDAGAVRAAAAHAVPAQGRMRKLMKLTVLSNSKNLPNMSKLLGITHELIVHIFAPCGFF